jgi:hypothetical protein
MKQIAPGSYIIVDLLYFEEQEDSSLYMQEVFLSS